MALRKSYQEKIIRFTLHPLFNNNPIAFKSTIKNSERILVYLPAVSTPEKAAEIIETINTVFKGKQITLVADIRNKKNYPAAKIMFTDTEVFNILKIGKHEVMNSLKQKNFDIFIDLDPDEILLNFYICRRLRPQIKITFSKPLREQYYNMEYRADPSKTRDDNTLELLEFIKKLQ